MEEENEQLNKGVLQLKNITMTDTEKKHILDRVLNTPARTRPVESPWMFYTSFNSFMNTNRVVCFTVVKTTLKIITFSLVSLAKIPKYLDDQIHIER